MILEINGLHVYYGDSHILHGISLGVEENQVIALLGRNGVGKTTLVRSIMGLTPARRGQIRFSGEDISRLQPNQIARKGIGLVPQGRFIFPSLSVYENLMVTHRGDGGDKGWDIERVLDFFPRLRQRIKNRGKDLSGGEQQMLAIGRALVTNPRFLLMDEPSEGLAPLVVREIGRLVRACKEAGYPIFLVEQNLRFAFEYADVVYVMSKGTIVYRGLPAELRDNEEVKKAYLSV
jgi:branched-chain amino acid transport system ATP-binding protein